jgi:CIC family chloride channel protein
LALEYIHGYDTSLQHILRHLSCGDIYFLATDTKIRKNAFMTQFNQTFREFALVSERVRSAGRFYLTTAWDDTRSFQPFSSKAAWRLWIKRKLSKSPLAEDTIPLLLAIVVGVVTGFSAYAFILLLGQIGDIAAFMRDRWGVAGSLGLMTVAGFITGVIISRFAREAKGHGVPEVMEAIALKRGRIRPRVAIAKIIASAITIGSGGSAGREGPIVQVGSAVGSTAGQWARLNDEQVGMLVASGAAAGIAATFNAPIAGTLFALEVILGRFTNRYLGIVVISSVSANVVSRILIGEHAAFAVPAYGLNNPLELPIYLLMGIACAVAAIGFIRVLYGAEHVFDSWKIPLPIKTGIGMGLTALIGIAEPEALGPGLEFIGETIAEELSLTVSVMFLLLIMKLLATTFTLGTGNSGGVFAPGLFMGAMVGGIFGQVGANLFPGIVTEPGAFALVGMAAMFAGTARAPITAIIIVLEMSNDYRLILPLLMTVIISTLIADLLHPDTIYTRKLALRGVQIERGHDVDLLQGVRVGEVMTKDYPSIHADLTMQEILPRFNMTHHHGFVLLDDDEQLVGILTLTDVERMYHDETFLDMTARDVGTTENLITVFPHDPIYLALRRMNIYDIGRLPVVSAENGGRFLGLVRRGDVLRAYEVGLTRKSIEQHQQKYFDLRNVEENEFVEVVVAPDAPMVGQPLAQFPHSDCCHVVSIRRSGQVIIPQGNTRIEPDDIIIAYIYADSHDEVIAQFEVQATTTMN